MGLTESRSSVARTKPLLLCSLTCALFATPAWAEDTHVVRGRFAPGATDAELAFVFDVIPALRDPPIVRWLGPTPRHDARTLPVQGEADGRWSVVLSGVPSVDDGQLLIEIIDPAAAGSELHRADFALREHVPDGIAARPSRDGRFVVFTTPDISPAVRLLLGSGGLLEDLPAGVTDDAVLAIYSLDFLPAAVPVEGWMLTLAYVAPEVDPALYYLPPDGTTWESLVAVPLPEHPLVTAPLPGPGTFLLARGVTR